ncbi:putative Alpha-amylase [Seiridium unicorne]|uniref:Alpha-amylase n=1 Tax=Seiridium unicorne TaxID=138068 RepID=A0ABR2V4U7_9PEZI
MPTAGISAHQKHETVGVPYEVGATVYQILVDRFYDGDTSNNGPLEDTERGRATNTLSQTARTPEEASIDWRYRLMNGGDWKGVTKKIDYIAGMGFKAIWISPISEPQLWASKFPKRWMPAFRNASPDEYITLPSAYHGYNAFNPDEYNHFFGTREDLRDLVNAAHDRGMSVVVDIVANHVGSFLDPQKKEFGYSPKFFDASYTTTYRPAHPWDNTSWYKTDEVADDPTLKHNMDYLVSKGFTGLDNFNYRNTDTKRAILNATAEHMAFIGADAMRIDAGLYVYPADLHDYEKITGLKSFVEIFDDDVRFISQWMTQEHQRLGSWGLLDFPLYHAIQHNFAQGRPFTDWNKSTVASVFAQDNVYGRNALNLQTFVDNHDVDRFLTQAGGDIDKLHQALIFLFTVRGQPIVLYGTEQEKGNDGGKPIQGFFADTKNRWSMFTRDESSGEVLPTYFRTDTGIYQLLKKLNGLRDRFAALRTGLQREVWVDDSVYAFSRQCEIAGPEIIAIFSIDRIQRCLSIPLQGSALQKGSKLVNVWDDDDVIQVENVNGTNKVTVCVGAFSNKIYHGL